MSTEYDHEADTATIGNLRTELERVKAQLEIRNDSLATPYRLPDGRLVNGAFILNAIAQHDATAGTIAKAKLVARTAIAAAEGKVQS